MNGNFLNKRINKFLLILNNIIKNETNIKCLNLYENNKYETLTQNDNNVIILHQEKSNNYIIIYKLNKVDYVYYVSREYLLYNNLIVFIFYDKDIKSIDDFYNKQYVIKYTIYSNQVYVSYPLFINKTKISKKIEYEKFHNGYDINFIYISQFNNNFTETETLYNCMINDTNNRLYIPKDENMNEFNLYKHQFEIYRLYEKKIITKSQVNKLLNYIDGIYLLNKLIN